jgi:cell division protein FtsB
MKSKKNYAIVDIILITFFFLSIFYAIYLIFFSKNNYKQIAEYKRSIKYLDNLIVKERQRNTKLMDEYQNIQRYKSLYLKSFARDYLFLIPKDEWVILKKDSEK